MDFLERVLVQGGEAATTAWSAMGSFLVWLGRGLEAVLQPVLGPLLSLLNPICTVLADAVYAVLSPLPPWVGLFLISAAAGIVMLVAFRYLSNQSGIARAKDDIKANLLALKLFKDDLGVAIRAQGRILWALIRLQRYVIVPVLWMALPTMLLLAQMAMRYQWRPLSPGETFIVRAQGNMPRAPHTTVEVLEMPGLKAEVGPIAGENDFAWRFRAEATGRNQAIFKVGDYTIEKEIVVGDPIRRISPVRSGRSWVDRLLYPIEAGIDDPGRTLDRIVIEYPPLKSYVWGSDWWVLTFFVVSMAMALALKSLFKVRF